MKPLPWVADQGDGSYRNPVLYADYSDPDAVRVGEDYWLTSSSFSHVPGLPILHSRDLVNWTLVNHALPRLVPEAHFSTPRHGGGVWAPSIRFHAGRYWIFYPDPDFGIYLVTTEDPRTAWTEPVLIKGGKGLIDPCPLWEEDGTGYLIHGWAKSRSGIKNRLTLHRLRPDNLGVSDAGEIVVDGDKMAGWDTIEGPKLYRRNGYYYIFAPAGGVTHGFQAVFRSPRIQGPYEERIVLARGSTAVNGPHQGAWVDTPEGGDWFLHFQELPAYGRVLHLQPVRWQDDWPVVGDDPDGDGTGQPVSNAPLPRALKLSPTGPATSDDFRGRTLARQWQWQGNPESSWASLDPASGTLRLQCVPLPQSATLWSAPHLLMQKFPAPEFQVTTRLAFAAAAEGESAGLVVFGFSYAWIGLRRERGQVSLHLQICEDAHTGGSERTVATQDIARPECHLRVNVTTGGRCEFAYSLDGVNFTRLGDVFQARSSYWVGAKVGLFASSVAEGSTPRGWADYAGFEVGPLLR